MRFRFYLLWLLPVSSFAAPTFNRDIAPITNEYCAPCHRPGQPGPFPLLTYNDVKRRAAQIGAVTKSRYMPPWLPQPGYGHFSDERRLSDAQIHTIQQWIAAGLPEGAAADAPPAPHFTEGWQLGQPDLILEAAQPFILQPGATDQFWNFILHVPLNETRFVKAVEIRPGNTRIVHHANLLVDRANSSRLREAAPGLGFEGMDLDVESNTFDPDSHFLFWKPGSAPYVEPPGMAWRLDKGNDLVLNVHLQATGKPEQVRPSVGLYFTDEKQTKFPMLIQLEHDAALQIPAGARDFQVTDDFRLPLGADLLSIYPHAHYLGKVLEGYATLPDGKRLPLIRIPDWDLNWQAVYRYREPLFLPKGTVISMRFCYDNSADNPRNPHHPPQRVVAGNQATDEMGHLWLQVLPSGGEDQRPVLQEAIMRHRLDKYPGDFTANFNLGALTLTHNQPTAAIPFFRDALHAKPDSVAALNALGAAQLASGQSAAAQQQFEHVLRLQPGYTNARYNLANLEADNDHFDEAIRDFHEVLKESPDDVTAREHLFLTLSMQAAALVREGRLQSAEQILREALAIHPDNTELRSTLNQILQRPHPHP